MQTSSPPPPAPSVSAAATATTAVFPDSDISDPYTQHCYGLCALPPHVVVNTLHRAVRSGDEPVAQQAAATLVASMHTYRLCCELLILSASDVGLANLQALEFAFRTLRKHDRLCRTIGNQMVSSSTGERSHVQTVQWRRDIRNNVKFRRAVAFTVHVLCRSSKSRDAMHAAIVFFSQPVQDPSRLCYTSIPAPILRGNLEHEARLFHHVAEALGKQYNYDWMLKIGCDLEQRLVKQNQPALVQMLVRCMDAVHACNNNLDTAAAAAAAAATSSWKGKSLLALAVLLCTRPLDQFSQQQEGAGDASAAAIPTEEQLASLMSATEELYRSLLLNTAPQIPQWPNPSLAHVAIMEAQTVIHPRSTRIRDIYYQQALDYATPKS